MAILVKKRDGRNVDFDNTKVFNAIFKAFAEVNAKSVINEESIWTVVREVEKNVTDIGAEAVIGVKAIEVDNIQDIVTLALKNNGFEKEYEAYQRYRMKRDRARNRKSPLYKKLDDITFAELKNSNIKRENGNIDGESAMGKMLRYGSETSKDFFLDKVIDERFSFPHKEGFIHIHDMDFYGITTTCTQIDIQDLLSRGFNTGHGFVRPPNSIQTAANLAAIIIQSNQNDQHGGQSIPNFDLALAKYVKLQFNYEIGEVFDTILSLTDMDENNRITALNEIFDVEHHPNTKICYKFDEKTGGNKLSIEFENKEGYYSLSDEELLKQRTIAAGLLDNTAYSKVYKRAKDKTNTAVYQAMEAFVFNLNTMHSRCGSQVPFSSINYGTETSPEARMLMWALLRVTDKGLGNGETAIFPIQIFRVMEGVNYNKEDPNYDLFKYAMYVAAKRFFPNWEFQDSPFNLQYYKPGHPETMVSTMGCRTRLVADVTSENPQVWRRGNLSFTTINLPRLALLNKGNWDGFYASLDKYMELVKDQLLERFELQCRQKVKNFKFLMGENVWLGSEKLNADDELREVLKHGSLSIGFIGLAETLIAMTGKHHGEDEEVNKIGIQIIKHMRDYCDAMSKKYNLNFTLLATPAEGLSDRFTNIDRKKFGKIKGITDKGFYTNSCHLPVDFKCSVFHKIKTEAPYHELCNAGHILYVKVDGDASKNLDAYEKIVRCMHDNNVGYGAVNIDVDFCRSCHFNGIIDGDECPVCGSKEIDRIRRITGYLVGTLDRWGNGKKLEFKLRTNV